jgi:hypothetical protein
MRMVPHAAHTTKFSGSPYRSTSEMTIPLATPHGQADLSSLYIPVCSLDFTSAMKGS